MSWSFGAIGKPSAVAAKAEAAKATNNACVEPEEGFRQSALDLIVRAAQAFPESSVVHVEASGNQGGIDANGRAQNTLRIDLKPVNGFVE